MRKFEPVKTADSTWRLEVGALILEVESPYLDRAVVRATLTVRSGEAIRYRNHANLTSETSRARILKTLKGKGIKLTEAALIALEDACRRRTAREREPIRDGGVNISETPPLDLDNLTSAFAKSLLITDPAVLPVFAGTILAHRLEGDPVWLLMVTPPGGAKTELLRTLYGYPGIYPLSDLTARTFASGLDKGNPSLLGRLRDEILVLKDFTTILEGAREERQAILAQLREIYDGRFDKAWGTGREFTWKGRLGFVAGVTPVIDQHQAAMSILGPRFITFRPIMADRQRLARCAIRGGGREADMRAELAAAMHGFLRSRTSDPPIVRSWVVRQLATMADFVTRARSPVHRDGRRRDLQYAPEPEAPTRLGKVLRSLGSGIAMAHDRAEVTGRDLAFVGRVALDTVPGTRHRIVKAMLKQTSRRDPTLQTADLVRLAKCSKSTALRSLEDLHSLGVVDRDGPRSACEWAIRAKFAAVLRPFGSRA